MADQTDVLTITTSFGTSLEYTYSRTGSVVTINLDYGPATTATTVAKIEADGQLLLSTAAHFRDLTTALEKADALAAGS